MSSLKYIFCEIFLSANLYRLYKLGIYESGEQLKNLQSFWSN